MASCALAAQPAAAHTQQPDTDGRSALERVVAAGAPGAVAFGGGGTMSAGLADVERGRRMRAGDRVRIGSITKSFVAVVALQLVQEGRLRLDDTVGDKLPGVLPQADRVTLRQLLNHTSGVPDDVPAVLKGIFFGDRFHTWTPRELLGLAGGELRFQPGTGWAYSNTDYVLVGLMIRSATGHGLRHELDRRIVRPLGLHDTSFPYRESGLGRGATHGYSLAVGQNGPVPGPLRDITRYSPSFGWSSGNAVSTVGDVAHFYRALLRGRLLSSRMLHQALSSVATGQPGRRYGLGLELNATPQGVLVGHEGQVPGFDVRAVSTQDGRRQAVVAANVKFSSPAVDDAMDAALTAAIARRR